MIPAPVTGTAATAALAVAVAFMLLHQSASPSSAGTGIQAGPVRMTAAPGTTRQARVTVMNTGSGTETLSVRGYRLGGTASPVPLSWIRGTSVTLAPGAQGTSLVTVTVPGTAAAGQYRGDILASAAPGGGQVSFGAAALAAMTVTVTTSAASGH